MLCVVKQQIDWNWINVIGDVNLCLIIEKILFSVKVVMVEISVIFGFEEVFKDDGIEYYMKNMLGGCKNFFFQGYFLKFVVCLLMDLVLLLNICR